QTRLGVLLCVNGTGILNSWLKHQVAGELDYEEMNATAREIPIGSDGLLMMPFGNGAERVLNNQEPGAQLLGLNFNRHQQAHLFRAAQEGIVFSFQYGLEIMAEMGIAPAVIRAGRANMFLSDIFADTLAGLTNTPIELYNTDGAAGAARGAGLGAGHYANSSETFEGLTCLKRISPNPDQQSAWQDAYQQWKQALERIIS
ncbi:MAG: FGGY-family carbohydrate kinase, partial [Bacteroidota bacterium]